ncbi:MAG: hypothetical protein Q8O43_05745 [Dehalococcoidia bacterium]|nr:hypothetical protein [Dehalococcoidia bacterium]
MKISEISIQVFGALLAILVGLVVAIITNILDRKTREKEREEASRQLLVKAASAILAEVEFNLGIAKTPFLGRLIPFITTVFNTFQGDIKNLPNGLQVTIFGTYQKLVEANGIIQTDLHKVAWGGGYLDNVYKDKCKEIIGSAEQTKTQLGKWLNDDRANLKKVRI